MSRDDQANNRGLLVENYSLLTRYLKLCRERGLECMYIFPSSWVLTEILRTIEKGKRSMKDLVDYVERLIGDKLECDICIESFKQVYGLSVECSDAKKQLILQITNWYIDILYSLGYVDLRPSWKP